MKYLLPRFQDILFLSVFCGALLLGSRMLSIDSDLGRHLTIGEYILDQHETPTKRQSKLPVTALVLAILTAAESIHWLPHPHVFAFLLLAIWLVGHYPKRLSTGTSPRN
jgi:hypothetical protein